MQTTWLRSLSKRALVLMLLAGAGSSAIAAALAPENTGTGTIQQLDFASGTMIVDGSRYHAAPELQVEIGGSYGAFTMLKVGMKIQLVYRLVSGSRRDVIEITELPESVFIEEA
ncbi:MAG: hypothetical protein O7E57_14880 [Gammaproteobacteria bacterium]|nr:hypothetical protein [Gammaproteobacteria bacterium]